METPWNGSPAHLGGGLFLATNEDEAGVGVPDDSMSVNGRDDLSVGLPERAPGVAHTRKLLRTHHRPPYVTPYPDYMNSGVNTLSAGLGDTHAQDGRTPLSCDQTWHHIVLTWDNGKFVHLHQRREIHRRNVYRPDALDPGRFGQR